MALNAETFEEVFSNLPAKALCRFKSVCKGCNELTGDDFFLKKHSTNMQSLEDSCFFLQANFPSAVELHSLVRTDRLSCGVPVGSLYHLSNTGQVLASNNGLVCCKNTEDQTSLFLCNPAAQTWVSIPMPDCVKDNNRSFHVLLQCNEGCSEFPDHYVLIIVASDGSWSSRLCAVTYSPEERVWKDCGIVEAGSREIDQNTPPVYIDGTVYLMTDCFPYLSRSSPFYRPYIVAYETKNSASRFLKIPKAARKGIHDQSCQLRIFKWNSGSESSICLVRLRKSVFSVWKLVDSDFSRWKHILKMRAVAMGIKEPQLTIAGFTVINGNSLLIATNKKIYRFKLAGGVTERKVVEVCGHTHCGKSVVLHSYSNTLRPCGHGAVPVFLPPI
ncbi:hypothetical protein RJ640_026154 [Escallonia rubra]|uniref:F-box domain-containing protein n=1 Tax=Escallonia rubra TaxID=112253 RepID=A0AA88SMR1_9ASTE|nr:hypothetical protein RJ640_026154 [Escallonia rubra]